MSRALYHLSYGTAQAGRKPRAQEEKIEETIEEKILSCGLRPGLELALLHSSFGQRHSFPLVQCFSRKISAEPGTSGSVVGSRMVAEVGFEPTTFGL